MVQVLIADGGLGTMLVGDLAGAGVDVTLFVKPARASAFEQPVVCISS